MRCRACGYEMDPFDRECKRCGAAPGFEPPPPAPITPPPPPPVPARLTGRATATAMPPPIHGTCPLCHSTYVTEFTKSGQVISPVLVVFLFLCCLWPLIFLLFLNKPDRVFRHCSSCGHIWQIM